MSRNSVGLSRSPIPVDPRTSANRRLIGISAPVDHRLAELPDAVRADRRVAWEAPEPKVPEDHAAPAAERREAKLAPRFRWDVPKRSAELGQTRVFADQDLAEIVARRRLGHGRTVRL